MLWRLRRVFQNPTGRFVIMFSNAGPEIAERVQTSGASPDLPS
jgi:hypothetical protein